MFFFFPFVGGGGLFGLILFFIMLRLIIRSLGFRNSSSSYRYYQFHTDIPGSENMQNKASSKAYSVLGIPETATDDEVKKAYRKLTLEYHPDTIAGKGLGPEFTEFAASKFREVQKAYEEICKDRNIK